MPRTRERPLGSGGPLGINGFLREEMRRIFSLMLLGAGMMPGFCSVAIAQDRVHIEGLFTQLDDTQSAEKASERLKTLAQGDADARQYIAKRIPSLIAIAGQQQRPMLWQGSLVLAGDLKIVEAVPLLTELIRKDNHGVATNFMMAARLYDDPVAKALSLIGEPATDSVAGLFKDGDPATRRRAAIVLWNIGTPRAREALLHQIGIEPDQQLRAFMETKVN
jgi:HEAT repeat protein